MNPVTAFLNEQFPNRWIGNKSQTLGPATGHRHEHIKWPARSPDLTSPDFFFWSFVKNKLYEHKQSYDSIDELKNKIVEISNSIPRRKLRKVARTYYHRLGECSMVEGKHFEHLRKKKNST